MMDLKPGDILLYHTNSLLGWLIRTKTWSTINHSETYFGDALSGAARKEGVNTYPIRLSGLAYVLRPNKPFDFSKGMEWHQSVIGQPYDWFGLLKAFFTPGSSGTVGKQWCSEYCTRFARQTGLNLFDGWDAEKISPSMLLLSEELDNFYPDGRPVPPVDDPA